MGEAPDASGQDAHYSRAAAAFGAAIERLARGYEADPELRRDLVQEMHVALWRSFAGFDNRCSERTWVYRVAHNIAASHVRTHRRIDSGKLVGLDEADGIEASDDLDATVDARRIVARLITLIQRLRPTDRQVMLLYLEDLSATEIGEVTGLSQGAVAVRIHRIKALLSKHFAVKEEI